ncbi:MAG: transporter periplasmic subunit [Anaerocolumna sp.]|jgi:ABC-type glycerol-3-phosphate transport system substrate-binding protein|nr:transporter periplasmic subunit [Anaerocolumna sp.]
MRLKKFMALGLAVVMTFSLAACGTKNETGNNATPTEAGSETEATPTETDLSSLKGSTINVYTQGGNLVLGEEKKDDKGNTYRDESSAYLKHLAEKFTAETGINVELHVAANEDEVRPLFQVKDDSVDVYTMPNWSIDEWASYADPYCTVEEAQALYGDYALSMPNKDGNIYSIMPAKAYNQAVVYNEEVIKAAGYDEIPGTLEEFNKLCEAIKANGVTPISLHRIENWPLATVQDFAGYVAGNANIFVESLKTENPFSPESPFGKTIKMYTEWKANGYFEPEVYTDFGVAMDSVAYGKAGMMLFGSWVVPQIQGRVPEGKDPASIKFAPAPDFGAGRYVLAAPASNWAISKFSKNKEASRAFIEYIANDAQFAYDQGFIANKKGVEPKVPELYAIIDEMVGSGEAKALIAPASDANTIANQDVLTEAGLYADYKYVGLLFDSLDVTKPDDWTAYNKQVDVQNKAYAEYKDELGVEWVD